MKINMDCRHTSFTFCSILASLNLPAALDDLSGAKVPASLLEKAATLKEKGGYDHLSSLMHELPELLTRNKEILDEVSTEFI
jgi:programmed cell death 6-interacting protein